MIWNYIIAAIIGIAIYQVIVMLVYNITKYNEDALIMTSMLLPFGVCNYIIMPIVRKVWFEWSKKHLNAYRAWYYRDSGKLDGYFQAFYATDKMVARLNQDESKKYFVKKIRDGKDFEEPPRFDEVYRGQEKVRGLDMTLFEKAEAQPSDAF